VSGSITRAQFIALFEGEHEDDDDDEDDDDEDDEDDDDVIDELLKAKKSGDVFVHVAKRPNAPLGVWKRRFGLLDAKFLHHGSKRNRVFDCRIVVQGSRVDAVYAPSSADAKRAHAFTLETASGEVVYIATDNALERAEWIAALTAVARDRAGAPPTALSRAADVRAAESSTPKSSEPRRGVDAKPPAPPSSASAAAALLSVASVARDRAARASDGVLSRCRRQSRRVVDTKSSEPRRGGDAKPPASPALQFGGPLSVAADRVGVAPKSPLQYAAYSAVPDASMFDSQNGKPRPEPARATASLQCDPAVAAAAAECGRGERR
jgi:hypothetical protein